jgi:CheY-like chemotaxis protein
MLDDTEDSRLIPPCLILAHDDFRFALATSQSLRRLGWDVSLAGSGPEVRRLAGLLDAPVVVLDANWPGESGWLTCAKLTAGQPHLQVVLITDLVDDRSAAFASFVGAVSVVSRKGDLPALLEAVSRPLALPAAS